MQTRVSTHLCSPLKEDRFFSRAPAKAKGTHGLGRAILEAVEHFIQPFMAKSIEEEFTFLVSELSHEHSAKSEQVEGRDVHIWPWKAL